MLVEVVYSEPKPHLIDEGGDDPAHEEQELALIEALVAIPRIYVLLLCVSSHLGLSAQDRAAQMLKHKKGRCESKLDPLDPRVPGNLEFQVIDLLLSPILKPYRSLYRLRCRQWCITVAPR